MKTKKQKEKQKQKQRQLLWDGLQNDAAAAIRVLVW
jgi:hypothetical protein